jgi:hypothetical protein
MDINGSRSNDDAQEILEALHEIQVNPELRAEAESNPEGVLDRLGLSGVARHAVAFGIAGFIVSHGVVKPMGFWQ